MEVITSCIQLNSKWFMYDSHLTSFWICSEWHVSDLKSFLFQAVMKPFTLNYGSAWKGGWECISTANMALIKKNHGLWVCMWKVFFFSSFQYLEELSIDAIVETLQFPSKVTSTPTFDLKCTISESVFLNLPPPNRSNYLTPTWLVKHL